MNNLTASDAPNAWALEYNPGSLTASHPLYATEAAALDALTYPVLPGRQPRILVRTDGGPWRINDTQAADNE